MWCRSQLQLRYHPWPGNFHRLKIWPKKKKKKLLPPSKRPLPPSLLVLLGEKIANGLSFPLPGDKLQSQQRKICHWCLEVSRCRQDQHLPICRPGSPTSEAYEITGSGGQDAGWPGIGGAAELESGRPGPGPFFVPASLREAAQPSSSHL